MIDTAKLSELAQAEIETLQGDGISLTPAEIVEINALAWAVEKPETRRLLSRGVPVEVGGVYLWPMTLYGQEWFDRVGCQFTSTKLQNYALAYAMAHGREDGDRLAAEGRKAEKDIMAWVKTLRCTFGELIVAVDQVLQQDEEPEQPPNKKNSGMTLGEFSAFLASACGATPDFWERRCAASYTYAMLEVMVKQNAADDKPCASDPKMKAERALGWKIDKIRESRKEQNG